MQSEDYRDIFASNLNYYMDKNNVKQIDLVNKFHMSKSTVSSWCNGVKIPRMDKIERLAEYFGVSKSDLIEKKAQSNIVPDTNQLTPIPVIVRASDGIDCLAEDNIIDYEYVPQKDIADEKDYVFLRVTGDSMYPTLMEGDLILVRRQSSADSGSLAVVTADNEDGAVKRIVYGKNFIELQPINPMYSSKRFENSDISRIQIFGVVRKIIRNFV